MLVNDQVLLVVRAGDHHLPHTTSDEVDDAHEKHPFVPSYLVDELSGRIIKPQARSKRDSRARKATASLS